MNWKPIDGYNDAGFHHWFCYCSTTGHSRGSYTSYAEAVEACRRLNGC